MSFQIKKDEINSFLKRSEEIVDNQQDTMHNIQETIRAEAPTVFCDERVQKALKELDSTSQKLRLEMYKARMIIKYQNIDKD